MSFRVAHVGAWGRNFGDRAIQWGVQQALGVDDWVIYPYDCQRVAHYDADQARALTESVDVILVGGGGLLWDKPELRSVSGWQWQVTMEFLEALRVPVVVWGVGWTAFPTDDDRTGQAPAFRETLSWLVENAAAFTARNPQTRAMLDLHGVEVERVDVAADPALGAPWNRWRGGGGVLALCWASDKPAWRWDDPDDERRALHAVVTAAKELGLTLRLVPHLAGTDERVRGYLRDEGVNFQDVERDAPHLYPATLERVEEWARLSYVDADVVVSMRKHGMLIPAGMGAPVLGLGELPEVEYLAQMLGVQVVRAGDTQEQVTRRIRQAKPVEEGEVAWARMCNGALADTLAGIAMGRWTR